MRQSSPTQILHNRESQLRQYNLADYASKLGFVEVETIDEDLGALALVWWTGRDFSAW